MLTIANQWADFSKKCYPDVKPETEQYRQLESTFFAAYFDLLSAMLGEIAKMEDDQAESTLMNLNTEARTYIKNHIEQEFQRQAVDEHLNSLDS